MKYTKNFENIIEQTISKFQDLDAFPVSIGEFSVEEKKGLCRFLLEICIHFEPYIKASH